MYGQKLSCLNFFDLTNHHKRSKFWVIVRDVDLLIFYLEDRVLSGHRNVWNGDLVIHSSPHIVFFFVSEIDDMDRFAQTLNVGLENQISVTCRFIDTK